MQLFSVTLLNFLLFTLMMGMLEIRARRNMYLHVDMMIPGRYTNLNFRRRRKEVDVQEENERNLKTK